MLVEHSESNKFHDAFDAFDSNARCVVGEQCELNKFYDALECNAHLVVAERYQLDKLFDAFHAFDSNA